MCDSDTLSSRVFVKDSRTNFQIKSTNLISYYKSTFEYAYTYADYTILFILHMYVYEFVIRQRWLALKEKPILDLPLRHIFILFREC